MKCQLEEQFFGLATRRARPSESNRLSAQLMLQQTVELEVTEFLGRENQLTILLFQVRTR